MALEPVAQQIFTALLGMWLGQASLPAEAKRHVECLAENVWFEARGTGFAAKLAVAQVVMNRVQRGTYAADVCAVVWAPAQFSWTSDDLPDRVAIVNRQDRRAWAQSVVAALITWHDALPDLTDGATHYHAHGVAPGWGRQMQRTRVDDAHRFYRRRGEPAPQMPPPTSASSSPSPPASRHIRAEMADRVRGSWALLPVLLAEPVGTREIERLDGEQRMAAVTPDRR